MGIASSLENAPRNDEGRRSDQIVVSGKCANATFVTNNATARKIEMILMQVRRIFNRTPGIIQPGNSLKSTLISYEKLVTEL
jgi:hypothetical protein